MIRLNVVPIALAALFVGGAPALAQSPQSPSVTTLCLDVSGATLPVVCQMESSRLDRRDVFCHCPEGQRVDAPVCGPNEHPPAETLALYKARRIAGRDGSLIGDTFEGRRMCVDVRGR